MDTTPELVTRLREPKVSHHQTSQEWEPYATVKKVHSVDPLRLEAADALEAQGREIAELRRKVSAGYKLAAKLCHLPEDKNEKYTRESVMQQVVAWRSKIDAAGRK